MVQMCYSQQAQYKQQSVYHKLLSRPLSVYEEIFKEQGISFEVSADKITLGGKLQSGIFKIKGNISSQFITGLLFVLPLLETDLLTIM